LASEQFTRAALPIGLGETAIDFFADAYLQGLLGPTRVIETTTLMATPAEAKPARN